MNKNKKTINKTIQDASERAGKAALRLGVIVMTTAAVVSAGEVFLHPHDERRTTAVVNNLKPAFATENAGGNNGENPLRREKENEAPHQFVSYSVFQRTPARSSR